MAKPTIAGHVDGGRQRCLGCGHPAVEHRRKAECTVPKCPCATYEAPEK